MDGQRFDEFARQVATTVTRRGVLGLVAGGAVGLIGLSSRRAAAGSCLEGGKACSGRRGEECCSGVCCEKICCDDGNACTGKGCCPAIQSCGELCCPPENVGCTELVLFDGTVKIGCLCKEGYYYADERCIPCDTVGEKCGDDVECCSGSCCDGACCPPGFSCDGETCICPDGELACKDVCCPPTYECAAGGSCTCPDAHLDCGDECVPKEIQGIEGFWYGCCRQEDCPSGWTCRPEKHICVECQRSGDCPGDQHCCDGNCWNVPAGCTCGGGTIQCPVDE